MLTVTGLHSRKYLSPDNQRTEKTTGDANEAETPGADHLTRGANLCSRIHWLSLFPVFIKLKPAGWRGERAVHFECADTFITFSDQGPLSKVKLEDLIPLSLSAH